MKWNLLLSAAAGATTLSLTVSSCSPVSPGGYIGTEPASWMAIQDMMPGAPRELAVRGKVTVAAANYDAALAPRTSARSPEYNLTVTGPVGQGAQVLTSREVSRRDPYTGKDRHVIVRFPDGNCMKVPIVRPN